MSAAHPTAPDRLDRYLHATSGPLGLVLDVGTRAARAMVGPKQLPGDDWHRRLFYNDSLLTNLGLAVDQARGVLPVDHPGFLEVARYAGRVRERLLAHGAAAGDMVATGTAIFRWLDNREEVLQRFEEISGLRPLVLTEEQEGALALAALKWTHGFRLGDRQRPGPSDALVLFDQGGGSLEVSWITPDGEQGGVRSFDQLGTIALRERLFSDDQACTVQERHARLVADIRQELRAWQGHAELHGRAVHPYAMGSAITRLVRGSSHQIHNRHVRLGRIRGVLEGTLAAVVDQQPSMEVLRARLVEEDRQGSRVRRGDGSLDAQLVLLCGLPVYAAAMEHLGIEGLRICGYGMRYGVFAELVAGR